MTTASYWFSTDFLEEPTRTNRVNPLYAPPATRPMYSLVHATGYRVIRILHRPRVTDTSHRVLRRADVRRTL